MTPAQITAIKGRIQAILTASAGVAPATAIGILPINLRSMQGKLYEAFVLSLICENLVTIEGCNIRLINGTKPRLKQKGGPINRAFPYFEVFKNGAPFGDLFTDIYFNTISYTLATPHPTSPGDYHELDIALVLPGVIRCPSQEDILLSAECKNTPIQKGIIREVLGLRRELSFHSQPIPTSFNTWPRPLVPANPPSVQMLYCSYPNVNNYNSNCDFWGIDLEYFRM